MEKSRFPKFYQLSVTQRLEMLRDRGVITAEDFQLLKAGKKVLKVDEANKMIENVIGVFGLPLGLGLNFLVNGRSHIVPMVVEEPSIVAAVSSAAKLIRESGGFTSSYSEPLLFGQIQVVNVDHFSKARSAVLQNKEEILNLANGLHPNMVARGGGAKDIEVVVHTGNPGRSDMMIVNLLVDTRDAMGANLVNSMCEGVAPLIEKITNGTVFLRILSNLADRALIKTKAVINVTSLGMNGYKEEHVRDGIILANDFACIDPYRATTHNKGIMNGIDAVAIATGNDFRSIEAAAHAYASRGNKYTSLTQWSENEDGNLEGYIELPMKIGTVGGSLESNPAIKVVHKILGIKNSAELAEIMGAVGLAQNFAALKALATDGIQRGHMSLHARSVAMAVGTPEDIFDEVVEKLIESSEIKNWKAMEITRELRERKRIREKLTPDESFQNYLPSGFGKIILLGEHAVVYGSHAVAAPIPLAIEAKVEDFHKGIHLVIPRWGVEQTLHKGIEHKHSVFKSLDLILESLNLTDKDVRIEVFPHIPRAMGLGGSAALAVSIIRALSEHFKLNLSDEDVNRIAYASEQVVHGTPSGIDNTMATYGKFILYKKGDPPLIKKLHIREPIPIVIGLSGVEGLTAKTVADVRKAHEANHDLYDRIFSDIDSLALESVKALEKYDLARLGELMNINQGLLNAIKVSTWELEELVEIARRNGALGAKLTGGGGGGAMIALCPDHPEEVASAIKNAGYKALIAQIG